MQNRPGATTAGRVSRQKPSYDVPLNAVAAWQALDAVTPEYGALSPENYKDAWNTAARDVYPPISGANYFVQQYCITGSAPTIPAVAPRKSKSIHGGSSYGLDVGYE